MNVLEALQNVMNDVQKIGKGDSNNGLRYSFRGVDAVMNAVGPALRAHGVVIAPTATVCEIRDVHVGSKMTLMRESLLNVTFTVWGPEGDSLCVQVAGEATDTGDKATAKAHSVAYRTALLQLFCVPTDDKDPDAYSYVRSSDEWMDVLDAKNGLVDACGGDKDRALSLWKELKVVNDRVNIEEFNNIVLKANS